MFRIPRRPPKLRALSSLHAAITWGSCRLRTRTASLIMRVWVRLFSEDLYAYLIIIVYICSRWKHHRGGNDGPQYNRQDIWWNGHKQLWGIQKCLISWSPWGHGFSSHRCAEVGGPQLGSVHVSAEALESMLQIRFLIRDKVRAIFIFPISQRPALNMNYFAINFYFLYLGWVLVWVSSLWRTNNHLFWAECVYWELRGISRLSTQNINICKQIIISGFWVSTREGISGALPLLQDLV